MAFRELDEAECERAAGRKLERKENALRTRRTAFAPRMTSRA